MFNRNKHILLLQGHRLMQNIYNKLADTHMYVSEQMYTSYIMNGNFDMQIKKNTCTRDS